MFWTALSLDFVFTSPFNSVVALPPGALFGLATFSHKIGLYDVQGPIPIVKNVFIPPDTEGTLPVELEDVMPLLEFLAPVRCESQDPYIHSFIFYVIAFGEFM